MLFSGASEFAKITGNLMKLSDRQATGELLISSNASYGNDRQAANQWHLYFFLGRLLYATGSKHRIRRWRRSLKQHCPRLAFNTDILPPDLPNFTKLWEYQLLSRFIEQGFITLPEAKAIIHSSTQEIFFNLAIESAATSLWYPSKAPNSQIALLEIEQIINSTQKLWQQWQENGLTDIDPNTSPLLQQPLELQKQISPQSFSTLNKLLDGQHTFWDISVRIGRSITQTTRFLLPFIHTDIIKLIEIPDLPSPITNPPAVVTNPNSPLIACIDDSPVLTHSLEKIIVPAGYRLLKIQEPLTEMSILVKHKPNLIFLDLIMPHTSGYSLCSFLRKTHQFRKTPIIILTGQDGIIDRTKAKLTGASDFLTKPPKPEKILTMIQKYLNSETKTTQAQVKISSQQDISFAPGV